MMLQKRSRKRRKETALALSQKIGSVSIAIQHHRQGKTVCGLQRLGTWSLRCDWFLHVVICTPLEQFTSVLENSICLLINSTYLWQIAPGSVTTCLMTGATCDTDNWTKNVRSTMLGYKISDISRYDSIRVFLAFSFYGNMTKNCDFLPRLPQCMYYI